MGRRRDEEEKGQVFQRVRRVGGRGEAPRGGAGHRGQKWTRGAYVHGRRRGGRRLRPVPSHVPAHLIRARAAQEQASLRDVCALLRRARKRGRARRRRGRGGAGRHARRQRQQGAAHVDVPRVPRRPAQERNGRRLARRRVPRRARRDPRGHGGARLPRLRRGP